MKTTVEIDDELLKAAKRAAVDEGTTLRSIIEDGLRNRLALSDRQRRLHEWGTPGSDITRGDLYEPRTWKILESLEQAAEAAARQAKA